MKPLDLYTPNTLGFYLRSPEEGRESEEPPSHAAPLISRPSAYLYQVHKSCRELSTLTSTDAKGVPKRDFRTVSQIITPSTSLQLTQQPLPPTLSKPK